MKSIRDSLMRIAPEIILLAIFNVLLHLAFLKNLGYHRDELLYFSLGMHPAAGYATVPPLIGWIAMAMQKLFGVSVFAVRLFPALMSGVMIFIAAALTKELGGSRYASFLAATGLTISVYFMRIYFLFMPVQTEIVLWTLCIYILVKYVNSQNEKLLILFGAVAGLALLNKYLAGILFFSLAMIVPFTEHRTVFSRKHLWYGLAAGLLVFMPNLIWQISKGLPVFRHMSELYDTQLVHMDIATFIGEQIMMPAMGSFLTVGGLIFLLSRKRAGRYWFLGLVSLAVILELLLMKGKSYYTLGVFPLLTCAGAVSYDKWIRSRFIRILFPVVLVLLTLPIMPMGLPVFGKEGLKEYFAGLEQKYGLTLGRRFEDNTIHSLPQDYADMIGWEELAAIADSAYGMVEDKKACFIYCENYGQAGAITVIGKKYGLPEAVCFSESFAYWFPEKFDPDITSMIYINDEPGDDLNQVFSSIIKIGQISDPDAREYGTGVWLCSEPKGSFNYFWALRLGQLRSGN